MQALADAGVNIVTLSLADAPQFGILRVVPREWEKAKTVLEETGCVVAVSEMVAVEVPDRPGALLEVIEIIESSHINIEYMYPFTNLFGEKGILLFRFEDPDAAIHALQDNGISVASEEALFQRIGEPST